MSQHQQAIRYAENRGLSGFDYQSQGQWQGPFFFIQGADPQLGLKNSQNPEPLTWEEEIELTNQAVAAANAMDPKPKFFIVCGDLVNAFPFQPHRNEQEIDVKMCLNNLNNEIPLICVCGNHDVGNTPTKESIDVYRNSFGDDYFSFWVQGMFCIVLNSQLHFDDSQAKEEREIMDRWLDEQLKVASTSGAKHVIVFQHIGLFLVDEDEEDDAYFNIPSTTRKILIEKFTKAGIRFVFCGHYHRNAGGVTNSGLNCVVTSAIGAQLGNDRSGFRLVKVMDDVISHEYFALEDVPKTVDLTTPEFSPVMSRL